LTLARTGCSSTRRLRLRRLAAGFGGLLVGLFGWLVGGRVSLSAERVACSRPGQLTRLVWHSLLLLLLVGRAGGRDEQRQQQQQRQHEQRRRPQWTEARARRGLAEIRAAARLGSPPAARPPPPPRPAGSRTGGARNRPAGGGGGAAAAAAAIGAQRARLRQLAGSPRPPQLKLLTRAECFSFIGKHSHTFAMNHLKPKNAPTCSRRLQAQLAATCLPVGGGEEVVGLVAALAGDD